MSKDSNREWEKEFDEKFEDLPYFYDKDDFNPHLWLTYTKLFIHQELKKARQDWLQEEIEFVKQVQAAEPNSNGRYNACNEIIDRYHSELDQDNNNN